MRRFQVENVKLQQNMKAMHHEQVAEVLLPDSQRSLGSMGLIAKCQAISVSWMDGQVKEVETATIEIPKNQAWMVQKAKDILQL